MPFWNLFRSMSGDPLQSIFLGFYNGGLSQAHFYLFTISLLLFAEHTTVTPQAFFIIVWNQNFPW